MTATRNELLRIADKMREMAPGASKLYVSISKDIFENTLVQFSAEYPDGIRETFECPISEVME